MAAKCPMGWRCGENECSALNSKSQSYTDNACLAEVFVNASERRWKDRQVLQPSETMSCLSTELKAPHFLSHPSPPTSYIQGQSLLWIQSASRGRGASTMHQALSNRAGAGNTAERGSDAHCLSDVWSSREETRVATEPGDLPEGVWL